MESASIQHADEAESRHADEADPRGANPSPAAEAFLASCLLLDLETGRDNRIHQIGAILGKETFRRKGRFSLTEALTALDRFADRATHALGHNIVSHDLPFLATHAPDLALLRLPVVDTLYLSPLAFPENPYHRLVKDYKLVRQSLNHPTADARLAAVLFRDQWDSFSARAAECPELLSFYRYAMATGGASGIGNRGGIGDRSDIGGIGDRGGISEVFARLERIGKTTMSEVPVLNPATALSIFARIAGDRICAKSIEGTVNPLLDHPLHRPAAAYVLAWLRVAGGNSVIPPWVRKRFPIVATAFKAMRDAPCDDSGCAYCRHTHDPLAQVRKYFGFDSFRNLPNGAPLQARLVARGMADAPLLGILPTGFGKSLCFQLPALVRYYRRGLLTVVISPLLSLMKDQRENLRRATGTEAVAAIYSLLTGPERGAALDGVRMGDVGLLYISPEQLRNHSVREALKLREIGAWVFDEAHCLSKWGHDFRPDYLYASRFIREFADAQGTEIPPVVCLTATAKTDVIAEIIRHFKDSLGQDLMLFKGGHERENLRFSVEEVTAHGRNERIAGLLMERLGTNGAGGGSAIVYRATRRKTDETAEYLKNAGLSAEAYHAGMSPPEKRRVQDAFSAGEIPIICATNAFGMGIDKPDVRLVIHADIPGSLESYLQEAGRAGRDMAPAECVLLHVPDDIETQFGLAALGEIRQRDIQQILRGLRRLKPDRKGETVITAGDLLRDDAVNVSFEDERRDADTRVKIAVSWLERAGFLERNENRTRVFQGKPRFQSMDEARRRLDRLDLSPATRGAWESVLEALFNCEPDEGVSADELFRDLCGGGGGKAAGALKNSRSIMETLNQMAEVGLIRQGIQFTAYVRPKGKNSARTLMGHVRNTEKALLSVLRELHPDDDPGQNAEQWLHLGLRGLAQRLRDRGIEDANPEIVKSLMRSLARDGRGLAGGRPSIDFRHRYQDQWRVRLRKSWNAIEEIARRREAIASILLDAILAKDRSGTTGEILVEFTSDELAEALRRDLTIHIEPERMTAAIDRGLLFLHEQRVILLQKGLAVFRQAMTIRILPEARGRRYARGDYAALGHHYAQRRFQIHVMAEYARLGLDRIRGARRMVADYFTLKTDAFIRRFFPDRRNLLEMATSETSFKAIVEALKNPVQEAIVASDPWESRLILAGPGSGKTRVVVHRCAYLLRVRRVPASAVLVLCFNRAAALAVRSRLRALVGDDAAGVTILTYHALAMRLTGTSMAARAEAAAEFKSCSNRPEAMETRAKQRLDAVIRDATALLRGEKALPGIAPDETRDRLMGGYAHILVDEYQDIDGDQYDLLSATAGRTLNDPEQKLSILAVGDDDQSIYGFRDANVTYIRRFQADYAAKVDHLVENYRSTGHIIAAANSLIARNADRMKTGRAIRVNRLRAAEPPGGAWSRIDPIHRGKPGRIEVADPAGQAAALVAEIRRLKQIRPDLDEADIAVLARNGMGHEPLRAIRAMLEKSGIPFSLPLDRENGFALHRVREIAEFIELLSEMGKAVHKASELINRVPLDPDPRNPWPGEILRALEDWREETGDAPLPVRSAIDFLYEAMVEQRRERRLGHGVHLSTVHGAKGMEFRHVFMLDGDWRDRLGKPEMEEDRRLFYVGMTRAMETLTLFRRRDCRNPHLAGIDPDHVIDRKSPAPSERLGAPPPYYDVLGMGHLNIGYAGRFPETDNIHSALRRLKAGDPLYFQNGARAIRLAGADGVAVACLSRNAREEWQDRLEGVERAVVLGMVRRYASDGGPDFRGHCRCRQWEVPIVEVVGRMRDSPQQGMSRPL